MTEAQSAATWIEPEPTALLALADGTILEGFGLGATGQAVGEVCFNTAMTGYEEILTDPSYAGQIITFTFPHIGNVGTNEEDIETVNLAATPGARGVILRTPITEPSNYRAAHHLDGWLKRRGIVGLCGIDTRALTRLIRERGMPNAVIAHEPSGRFDREALKRDAAAWPGLVGMDLVPMVTAAQRFTWDETPWEWGKGFGRQTDPEFHVVAIDYGVKRNILRLLAGSGCRVTVVPATTSADDILALAPDGVFLSNGPGDPAATGEYAVPVIRSVIAAGVPTFGICLGHQMLGLALGATTRKMHQGHHGANHPVKDLHDRQGRDHLDEPRLRGRPRHAARLGARDACVVVRRLQLRTCGRRPAGLLGAISPGGLAGSARQPLPVRALYGTYAGAQGSLRREAAGLAAGRLQSPPRTHDGARASSGVHSDPIQFRFADDGSVPNNPQFPFLVYKSVVALGGASDPAAVFERLFAAHGWGRSWRNGIYPLCALPLGHSRGARHRARHGARALRRRKGRGTRSWPRRRRRAAGGNGPPAAFGERRSPRGRGLPARRRLR